MKTGVLRKITTTVIVVAMLFTFGLYHIGNANAEVNIGVDTKTGKGQVEMSTSEVTRYKVGPDNKPVHGTHINGFTYYQDGSVSVDLTKKKKEEQPTPEYSNSLDKNEAIKKDPTNKANKKAVGKDNGLVVKINNLMWQKKDDNVKRIWGDAMRYCNVLSLGGYSGWRLPSIEELETLIDKTKQPTIDQSLFPNAKSSYYWSSTTLANYTSLAWYVYFNDGFAYFNDKTNYFYVRCVR